MAVAMDMALMRIATEFAMPQAPIAQAAHSLMLLNSL